MFMEQIYMKYFGDIMSYECNLKANRIGTITAKNLYDFKTVLNEVTERYEVIGKDGWRWSEATTPKGAVQGALACGVPLRKIDFGDNFIPIWELMNSL